MKKIIFILFTLLALIACSKKILPRIERRTEEPTAPKIEINIAAGELLFTTRCIKCHELPKPSTSRIKRCRCCKCESFCKSE
jgi:cytochrome c553